MSIAKPTAKAAEQAPGLYPETEFGLAAYLFESIAHAEKGTKDRDRGYYVQLMYECVRTIRAAGEGRA